MLRVVALVSGGGTNLQAIIDAVKDGTVSDTEIAGVIASKPGVYALTRCEQAGIPSKVVCRKDFDSKEARDEALIEAVNSFKPDLIVLAGYLTIIPEQLIKFYRNKIINIHPSLIPSFCGDGFYGLKVHEKALERGIKVTGATVHFVDEGTDTGPILMQKAVYVKPDDTPESLQLRVMQEAEWKILPAVINAIAHGKVKCENGKYFVED